MYSSPSDCWNLAETYGWVNVEDCISVKFKNNQRHVCLQVNIAGERFHKQSIVSNPLAMLSTIDQYRKLRNSLRADHVKRMLESEQAKIVAQYLERQRLEIQARHQQKIEQEQRRLDNVINKVRGPIQAILQRYKPVVDQFSYTNVYGNPAEVSFF